MKTLLTVCAIIICHCISLGQNQPTIIPLPSSYTMNSGVFKFENKLSWQVKSKDLNDVAKHFKKKFKSDFSISANSNNKGQQIILELINGDKQSEAYKLNVEPSKISITSSSANGIFYGLQSVYQMIHAAVNADQTIACCTIDDQPRFGWRGMMLDESRHFFGKEKVKQMIDMMALHKVNIFHWHLSDDPGWRIEIKKYPLLTKVGAIGCESNPEAPAAFYSQKDIKEIVAYAQERFIEIIPEIDMPGHARAANRAYPEFCGGGSERHPDFTFNPGKEGTYQYLTNILREVGELFPI